MTHTGKGRPASQRRRGLLRYSVLEMVNTEEVYPSRASLSIAAAGIASAAVRSSPSAADVPRCIDRRISRREGGASVRVSGIEGAGSQIIASADTPRGSFPDADADKQLLRSTSFPGRFVPQSSTALPSPICVSVCNTIGVYRDRVDDPHCRTPSRSPTFACSSSSCLPTAIAGPGMLRPQAEENARENARCGCTSL